jgi:hypothetical protein
MYNKLFTKILDSSIWNESASTRLVWITLLAAMDETGFVALSSVRNAARKANLPVDETQEAISVLESPDPESSDPDNEGRRIERVQGGWMVLNSEKYRAIATREHQKELNRIRVAAHRERKRNAAVTHANDFVTPSEAEAESNA